jgi:prepilin-type N-terminal cleavage/methylation domain-containing protein
MRGFSLVEAMIVVSIIAVLAAAAAPSMVDVVWAQRLEGAAEASASAIAAARMDAMTTKRCARVVIEPTALHVERLNVFDCDAPTAAPPPVRIDPDPSKGLWVRRATFELESPLVIEPGLLFVGNLPGGGGVTELRFRPSGRLFSQDETPGLASKGAVLVARHPKIDGARGTKQIGVQRNGLECVMQRGVQVPVNGAGEVVCPP